MRSILTTLTILIFLISGLQAQEWENQFNNLIKTPPGPEQEQLINQIAAAGPSYMDVLAKIRSISFPDTAKGKTFRREAKCIDGVARPYVIYVPLSYNPGKPAPMLVVLHGSVSRPNISEGLLSWPENSKYLPIAEKRGWILLFPMGQAGATWWDEVGMTNIMTQIRIAKIDLNIDDDRVYLGGFSDGGSAAFLFAMTMPTDFAAFLALNGHMGVGSEDGDLPTYAANLFNSPIFATTTDKDQLYPTGQMARTIEMAKKAGAKITYRQMKGEHNFDDIASEFPAMFDFLEKHPRELFPDTIFWETAISGFGACKWQAIDEITIDDPASWHVDHNIAMVDSSIAIGIQPSDTFTGRGVMVGSLANGDYLAKRIGLKPGDVIIGGNGMAIDSMADIGNFKATLRHGADVTLTVMRGNSETVLKGKVPMPKNYFLFKREQPSAAAKAVYSSNRFDIQGSRIGAFRILIHPEMIDIHKNVVVTYNGKSIFDDKVIPDIGYMLRDFLSNRDRKLVFVNEISLRPLK